MNEFANEVWRVISQDFESLAHLDNVLSNSYIGVKGSKNDKAVHAIRKQIQKALKALQTHHLVRHLKNLGKR